MSRYLRNLVQRAKGGSGLGSAIPMVNARPTPVFTSPTPTFSPAAEPNPFTASPPSLSGSSVQMPDGHPTRPQIAAAAQPILEMPRSGPAVITEFSAVSQAPIQPGFIDAPPASAPSPRIETGRRTDFAPPAPISNQLPTPTATAPLPPTRMAQPQRFSRRTPAEVTEVTVNQPARSTIYPPLAPSLVPLTAPQPKQPDKDRAPLVGVNESSNVLSPRSQETESPEPPTSGRAEPIPDQEPAPLRVEPRSATRHIQAPSEDQKPTAALVPVSPSAQVTPRLTREIAPLATMEARESSAERQPLILPELPTTPPDAPRTVKRSVEVHIGSLEVRFDAPEPPRPTQPPPAPRPTFDDYAGRRSYQETD